MEENLSNQQKGIDDAPDAMYNAFESDEEMLKFYLTMNRFVNPITYNLEKTALERLEDLHKTLAMFSELTGPIGTHSYDGVDNMIKGFGLYMTRSEISINSRYEKSNLAAYHFQFLFHLAENRAYAKRLSSMYRSHICQVNYLIRKLETSVEESANKSSESTEQEQA